MSPRPLAPTLKTAADANTGRSDCIPKPKASIARAMTSRVAIMCDPSISLIPATRSSSTEPLRWRGLAAVRMNRDRHQAGRRGASGDDEGGPGAGGLDEQSTADRTSGPDGAGPKGVKGQAVEDVAWPDDVVGEGVNDGERQGQAGAEQRHEGEGQG